MLRWLIVVGLTGSLAVVASCSEDDPEPGSPLNSCDWTCLANPTDPEDCSCHRAYQVDGGCGEVPDNPSYTLVESCPPRPCCVVYREQTNAGGDESDACNCRDYLPEGCELWLGVLQQGDLSAHIVASCPPR